MQANLPNFQMGQQLSIRNEPKRSFPIASISGQLKFEDDQLTIVHSSKQSKLLISKKN